VRLNDGRVDRSGRFWCSSMVEDGSGLAKACLYSVERGMVRPVRDGVHIGNGLAFSLDGSTLYFADSARHTLWRYPLADGVLGKGQVFAQTPGHIFPDGATVDSEDCLWVAHWGGAQVVRYTPAGRIDRVLALPVTQPSCVCFGGAQRDLLFVTSAAAGLAADVRAREPHAGDVFVYRVGVSGVDEPEYRR
jgi:sugar lactone lactonase YvrE